VLPVPLHPQRLRQRGFNQSELLAQPVAAALNVPLLPHGLQRRVATRQQANLTAAERRKNMTDEVFVLGRRTNVVGMGILLVDDVRTTGATLDAAAAAVKSAGAATVYALTLAIGV